MIKPNTQLTFSNGSVMNNRFMFAPITNVQSHNDGQLSDKELHWLEMRAKGGFGMIVTCASHVQENGKGFNGQLGIFSDALNEGHQKLTKKIKEYGSLIVIQLFHGGMRSPNDLIGEQSISASDNDEFDAREMTLEEIKQVKNNFVSAAIRSKKCGYDGVEIHAAHGYLIAQFLSKTINHRTDEYGGSLENRSKILFEIVDEIRQKCGDDFLIGVRLSPEKYGMSLSETKWIAQQLSNDDKINFLDISLWDSFKYPEEKEHQHKTLLEHFKEIDYKNVKWTVAGKIGNGKAVQQILDEGVDFVCIGESGILHHNFPNLVINNPTFEPIETPVSKEYLKKEGLSDSFINYLKKWPELVKLN